MGPSLWRCLAVVLALVLPGSAWAETLSAAPTVPKAVQRMAHRQGQRAVRDMVVQGGVKGSSSGNDYVSYYREGWNRANFPRKPNATQPKAAATPAPSAPLGKDYRLRSNPKLESHIRHTLAQSGPEGRQVVRQLDELGIKILFRRKGGTVNASAQNAIHVETHKALTGEKKPIAWLAASVTHEVSHAVDDRQGRTPPTVSPRFEEYREARRKGAVTPELRRAMVAERRAYVNGQVNGEARAMSREASVLRRLEQRGAKLEDLNRTVLNTYGNAYDRATKPPAAATPAPAAAR